MLELPAPAEPDEVAEAPLGDVEVDGVDDGALLGGVDDGALLAEVDEEEAFARM